MLVGALKAAQCTAVVSGPSLSSYAESEITSLVPQVPSSLPSSAVRSVSDGKLGGNHIYDHSIAKKRTLSKFLLRGHAFYISICSCYVH